MMRSLRQSDPSRRALLAALEMQVESGVDETIAERPIDRFTESAADGAPGARPATPTATTRPAETRPAGPRIGGARPAAPAEPPLLSAEEALAAAVGSARSAAAAARDLPSLAAALAAFEGSPLRAGATQCVFADGDPAARLMVIGEAPGKDEDIAGKPFVGPSGRLLDRMLEAIGLSRRADRPEAAVYITNVVPFRPLANRTPSDAEVSVLMPFLERHIALAAPEVVLCVGNVPAKHVMGAARGITQFRGTWGVIRVDGREIPALASFHPAFLLRSPLQKRLAWRDLQSLRRKLESG